MWKSISLLGSSKRFVFNFSLHVKKVYYIFFLYINRYTNLLKFTMAPAGSINRHVYLDHVVKNLWNMHDTVRSGTHRLNRVPPGEGVREYYVSQVLVTTPYLHYIPQIIFSSVTTMENQIEMLNWLFPKLQQRLIHIHDKSELLLFVRSSSDKYTWVNRFRNWLISLSIEIPYHCFTLK